MDRERLDILTGTAGTLLSAAEVPPAGRERLTQLDTSSPVSDRPGGAMRPISLAPAWRLWPRGLGSHPRQGHPASWSADVQPLAPSP